VIQTYEDNSIHITPLTKFKAVVNFKDHTRPDKGYQDDTEADNRHDGCPSATPAYSQALMQ
jgi:hypothetical protein